MNLLKLCDRIWRDFTYVVVKIVIMFVKVLKDDVLCVIFLEVESYFWIVLGWCWNLDISRKFEKSRK